MTETFNKYPERLFFATELKILVLSIENVPHKIIDERNKAIVMSTIIHSFKHQRNLIVTLFAIKSKSKIPFHKLPKKSCAVNEVSRGILMLKLIFL